MSVNFILKAIPGSSCARKEAVDIDMLITSTNGDRKIMQSLELVDLPRD